MPRTIDPAKLEANSLRIYGCSLAHAIELNEGRPLRELQSKARIYAGQRTSSAKRGIAWEISLEEWLRVWLDSGHWADRGVGVGSFCMARDGDAGPYKVGNVSIILSTQNSRDAVYKPGRMFRMPNNLGTGRGWTYRRDAKNNPFQVVFRSKYIGCYASQEEAEAIYRRLVDGFHSSAPVDANGPFFARNAKP